MTKAFPKLLSEPSFADLYEEGAGRGNKFGRVSRASLMGLENRPDEGSVVMRFWGAVSGAVEAVWGSFFGTSEAVLGHAEAVCAPPLHENMHAPVCTLLLSFRLPSPPPGWAQVASLQIYREQSSQFGIQR